MAIKSGAKGKQQTRVHYINSSTSTVVVENFEGLDLYFDDLELGEVLQDQESVYQSLMGSSQSRGHQSNRDNGQSSNDVNSSRASNPAWCASDEALARQLQELEDMHIDTSSNDFPHITSIGSSQSVSESNSTNNSAEVAEPEQDSIDPDNMTYEQLQSLGEEVGTESGGLSDELISYLATSEYKSDSSRGNYEACTICISAFEKGDKLMTLPCAHCYHVDCITTWLKIKKQCPVCKYEVFGPS